jgi:hypothetical protein
MLTCRAIPQLGLQIRQLPLSAKNKVSLLLHLEASPRLDIATKPEPRVVLPRTPPALHFSLNTRAVQTSGRRQRFAPHEGTHKVYEERFARYLDFISLVNFAHRTILKLKLVEEDASFPRYRVFVGSGNNSTLIR